MLGWPALKAVRSKRYWEKHQAFMRDNASTAVGEGLTKAERDLLDLQLGGASEAQICNLVGLVLLFLAFVFLAMAGIERRVYSAIPEPLLIHIFMVSSRLRRPNCLFPLNLAGSAAW